MFRALLIGCGNIGALYDLETSDVFTHAKAYSKNAMFKFTVYDQDVELAKKIANKYGVDYIPDIVAINFSEYDCVSICSPTSTHVHFLKMAFLAKVKVIICEKPISIDENELNDISNLYLNSSSKVIVNYIRRFQPSFIDLKVLVEEMLLKEKLVNINITYQKGFLNNASHAFDLLQFLFNQNLVLKDVMVTNKEFDFFKNDPTLSLLANWNNVPVNVTGLTNISFTIFELELFFNSRRIKITDSGKNITVYTIPDSQPFLLPLIIDEKNSQSNCIKNYMELVIAKAQTILLKNENSDNFMDSISLNKEMIKHIK